MNRKLSRSILILLSLLSLVALAAIYIPKFVESHIYSSTSESDELGAYISSKFAVDFLREHVTQVRAMLQNVEEANFNDFYEAVRFDYSPPSDKVAFRSSAPSIYDLRGVKYIKNPSFSVKLTDMHSFDLYSITGSENFQLSFNNRIDGAGTELPDLIATIEVGPPTCIAIVDSISRIHGSQKKSTIVIAKISKPILSGFHTGNSDATGLQSTVNDLPLIHGDGQQYNLPYGCVAFQDKYYFYNLVIGY